MAKKLSIPEQYIVDVKKGVIPVCEYVKLAIQRHLDDLEHGPGRGLHFEHKAGMKAISFFSFLKHSKGEWAGQQFKLEPWQQAIIYIVFGWKRKDGTRRFRYTYIEVAKKNGKTAIAAGVALNMFVADGEEGAEVYTAATSRGQAKICFNAAKAMVQKSPDLKKRIEVYQHNMHILSTFSKMEPLSKDSEKQEGFNPSCSIVDEFHIHKNTELYDGIKSALGARSQPLVWVITTAGFKKTYPCFRMRESMIKLLRGIQKQDNTFTIIYTLDENDAWDNEKNWVKANPNLGVSVDLDYLREECQDAKNKGGTYEVNFKTKNLNMWVDAESVWIKDAVWMKGADEVDADQLEGRPCFLGLDISEKYDISALMAFFPPQKAGEKFKVLRYFWIPEEKVEEKKDHVDYYLWASQGYVEIIPGNVVDDDIIIDKIMEISHIYEVMHLGYDEWNSKKLIVDLGKAGFPVDEKASKVTQYLSVLGEPTKKLEELARTEKLAHGGDPILRWMISNVVLKHDSSGNYRIDKGKSNEKIDGVSALVNAICEWITPEEANLVNEIYKETGL